MNPETNRFEPLTEEEKREQERQYRSIESVLARVQKKLLRPDGTPVPSHWPVFQVGELVVIKNYTFKVAYIGESTLLFEPVSPTDALVKETP